MRPNPSSRRRIRGGAFIAMVLALPVALAGGHAANAQVSSSTEAFGDLIQDNVVQFLDTKSKTGTNTKPITSQVNTPTCCTPSTLVASGTAFPSGALLQTTVGGFFLPALNSNVTTLAEFATASMRDSVTVASANLADHQDIVLHTTLLLATESNSVDGRELPLNGFDFDTALSMALHLTSEGIGVGPGGGDIFASNDFTANGDAQHDRVLNAPQAIDFTLDLQMNTSSAFGIDMFEEASGNFNVPNAGFGDGLSFLMAESLRFGSGVSITDAAGQTLCGLTITTASGTNLGSIPGCSGSGDGGGVGGGIAGVPEPASWALMIAGFGVAGAMLRRQRRALA